MNIGAVEAVRRRSVDGSVLIEVLSEGTWAPAPPGAEALLGVPVSVPWRERVPGLDGVGEIDEPRALLPFAPASFRDFMLYEEHVVSASREIARREFPGAFRVANLFERVTGRTFPKFKPTRLWFEQPIYYMGNALTVVPSGTSVTAPSYADALDYELELGFVLDRPLRDATPQEAQAAIGGFVVLNDFSARNVQLREMRSGFGPQKAKHFLTSMSENLVSATQVPDPMTLSAQVRLNGEVITSSSTRGAAYSLGEVIAFASRDEQLYPGELFGTGTLPGCSGIEARRLLRPGDVLELSIEGVGSLRHTVVSTEKEGRS